jgi:molecular chaperone HtpG
LGDKVSGVQTTERLTNSIARLVDAKGALGQEMQRVYRMMDRDYQIPKKILEINPDHTIIQKVSSLEKDDPRLVLIVEQIFDSLLLIEGLHPDPAAMIPRIQEMMEITLGE